LKWSIDKYYSDLEKVIAEIPFEVAVKLLDALILDTTKTRDYRIFRLLKQFFQDFILPDQLDLIPFAHQDEFDSFYDKEKYSTLLITFQDSCNYFLQTLKNQKDRLENTATKPESPVINNYYTIMGDLNQFIEIHKPETINNNQPENQETKDDSNTNYKVLLLHKLSDLKILNDTYFKKNPGAKKEKFAELIAIITDSKKVKLDTVKRYITAALADENIPTTKLKDELTTTLKEHNLD